MRCAWVNLKEIDPYKVLEDRVEEYIQYSRKQAIVWAWIYRITRGLIIILSTLVAAAIGGGKLQTVADSHWISNGVVASAALVAAILTSLESWLKPGEIYQAHYRYNTYYIFQEAKLALIPTTDRDALAHFAEQLDNLDKQYLEATREKK
jgi:hypothetical protein